MPLTDLRPVVAQRTFVEGHERFEDVRLGAQGIVDRVLDAVFEQIQYPAALVLVLEERRNAMRTTSKEQNELLLRCYERVRRTEECARDR